MPSPIDPTDPPSTDDDLDVRGAVPPGLSGRLVGIGRDGVVHSFHFDRGRVSYLARRIRIGTAVTGLVAFEGTILVYGEDSSVRQLIPDRGTLRRVDLAGHGRSVASCPKYDPASGEVHLLANDWGGAQAHVVVASGALTRRSRLIVDAPASIQGLAIGKRHLVFVADGVAGVAARDGELRTTWVPTGAAAPWPIHTHRSGDNIILLALTPSLERWTLHADGGTFEREVLDPTPRHFAHICDSAVDQAPGSVWTAGDETIGRHSLVHSFHTSHSVRPGKPGDFVIIADATRSEDINSGWFVGLVHDPSTTTTDLRVSDAADITEAIATIRIPRPISHRLRCTWMPATSNAPQQPPSPKEDRP